MSAGQFTSGPLAPSGMGDATGSGSGGALVFDGAGVGQFLGGIGQAAQGIGFGIGAATGKLNSQAINYATPFWATTPSYPSPYQYPQYIGPAGAGVVGAPTAYPASSQWPPATTPLFADGVNPLAGNMKWILLALAALLFVVK